MINGYAVTLMGMAILIGLISISPAGADTAGTIDSNGMTVGQSVPVPLHCDSGTICIDFEGLAEGAIVSQLSCGTGIDCPNGNITGSVAVSAGNQRFFDGGTNLFENTAMIFNADCDSDGNDNTYPDCSGEDFDLGFPGHGNMMINSEDRISSEPDDQDEPDSFMEFDFSQFGPGHVTVHSINVTDVEFEQGEAGAFLHSHTDEGCSGHPLVSEPGDQEIPIDDIGDHDIVNINVELTHVQCFHVHLNGSGSIDNIQVTVTDVPQPGIRIKKLTNDRDADDPDDTSTTTGVPQIAVRDLVTWTYVVTNTGNVDFAEDKIRVFDDIIGPITEIVARDNGNNNHVLEPGETWTYQATGRAEDLSSPPAGVTIVQGCNPVRNTYKNIGEVTAVPPTGEPVTDTDPSHYCNPPAPSPVSARITGGGWRVTGSNGEEIRSSGGFTLHCDIALSNNLQISWGKGEKWHIDKVVDAAFCKDDPEFTPGPPVAPADTYFGLDVGKLNNKDGSVACFKLEDHGETASDPDGPDQALIRIWKAGYDPGISAEDLSDPRFDCRVSESDPATDPNTVLYVPESDIRGNFQFHEDQPHRKGNGGGS